MSHQNIAIRFILAGSCHPFTGRQVMFVVPADPTLTLAQVITDHVQPNWPTKDLPDQQQKLQIEHLRVLKMGKVLTMEAPLLDAFSADEKKQALEVGRRSDMGTDQALIAGGESDQQNESSNKISGAVLMHLFFRPLSLQGDAKTTSPSSASPEKPKSEKTAAEAEGCGCIIA